MGPRLAHSQNTSPLHWSRTQPYTSFTLKDWLIFVLVVIYYVRDPAHCTFAFIIYCTYHVYTRTVTIYSVFIFILICLINFIQKWSYFILSNISLLLSLLFWDLLTSLFTAVLPVNFSQGGSIKVHRIILHLRFSDSTTFTISTYYGNGK